MANTEAKARLVEDHLATKKAILSKRLRSPTLLTKGAHLMVTMMDRLVTSTDSARKGSGRTSHPHRKTNRRSPSAITMAQVVAFCKAGRVRPLWLEMQLHLRGTIKQKTPAARPQAAQLYRLSKAKSLTKTILQLLTSRLQIKVVNKVSFNNMTEGKLWRNKIQI